MKPVSTACVPVSVSTAIVFTCPPGRGVGLEDRDLMGALEQVRGDEAGHPRTDDRDSHAHYSCVRRNPDHRVIRSGATAVCLK